MKTIFLSSPNSCFLDILAEITWSEVLFILIGVVVNTALVAVVAYIVSENYKLKSDKENQSRYSCTMYIIQELVWIDVLFISVGVVANSIVITMIVYFITKLYKLKRIRKELIVREVPDIKITNDSSKPLINSQKFKKDPEAIDIRRVQVLWKLETGNYGDIHNGLLEVGNSESEKTQLPILIKRISSSSSEIQKTMLLEELSVMRTVKPHPNVLCLVGVVLFKSQLPYTIFEYVEHLSLLDYLRANEASLENLDLNSFAYQIASGMKYLTSISIVHHDLSLKNISLTNDKIIKIGGLGLAGFDRDQYYIREITEDAPFSPELLSPEAFEEWEFTEKSDVWAFGVCLFELFSLGKVPYEEVDDIQEFLKNGERLAKPEYCSQEIYTLMLNCWNFDPVIRPTFSRCVEFFAQILDKIDPQIRPQLDQRLHTAFEHQKDLRKLAQENN